jgi:ribosomal-protein-serine acetyltransferase
MLSPAPDINLRVLLDRDAPDLFRLIEKNRTSLRTWLPWLDSQISVENSLDFIRATRTQNERKEALTLAIYHRGLLCGIISVHRIDWPNRSSMIGYWLSEDQRGHGIMTESCRAVVNHGFDVLGLHRIEIRCATGNRKSQAIPERLGFHKDAVLRDAEWLYDHFVDLIVYSMLAPEWRKLHPP